MKLKLSEDLSVDAVEYASRANAILGIRDSGKTYTATLIAEQLFEAGIPSFAFDPIGRWRFLKTPGKGRGFPFVVAGGVQPDLELTPESAPKLIRAAMKAGVSMVIDLYSVHLTKADWRKIVRASIETILYEGEGYGQRHVFLEEAAEFIPQKIYDGHTYAAVEKLARMGGNVGVGLTLINQRAEEVNKAVLELCDNLLLHRQRGKNSLLSLRKWLDAGNVATAKEITRGLADLPTGECWAWFKDVGHPKRIKVAQKKSFDPNRRATAVSAMRHVPSVDVSAFVANMKAALAGKPVPTSAKQEEKNVKESEARALRAENERLQKTVDALKDDVRRLTANAPAAPSTAKANKPAPEPKGTTLVLPGGGVDMDAIYAEVKRRASNDPSILAVLAEKAELTVTVQRKVVQASHDSLRGKVAILISEDFFASVTSANTAYNELIRRGASVAKPSVYKECDILTGMGFLTKESGGYQAVPGMKVNIIEERA